MEKHIILFGFLLTSILLLGLLIAVFVEWQAEVSIRKLDKHD